METPKEGLKVEALQNDSSNGLNNEVLPNVTIAGLKTASLINTLNGGCKIEGTQNGLSSGYKTLDIQALYRSSNFSPRINYSQNGHNGGTNIEAITNGRNAPKPEEIEVFKNGTNSYNSLKNMTNNEPEVNQSHSLKPETNFFHPSKPEASIMYNLKPAENNLTFQLEADVDHACKSGPGLLPVSNVGQPVISKSVEEVIEKIQDSSSHTTIYNMCTVPNMNSPQNSSTHNTMHNMSSGKVYQAAQPLYNN